MKARFNHFGALVFFGLVDCAKFQEMSQRFDDTELQSLSLKYDRLFDLVRLVSDLIGLYNSQQVLARKDLILKKQSYSTWC